MNAEKAAIDNLKESKQLASEMRKIPEANEPEETHRDYKSQSALVDDAKLAGDEA